MNYLHDAVVLWMIVVPLGAAIVIGAVCVYEWRRWR